MKKLKHLPITKEQKTFESFGVNLKKEKNQRRKIPIEYNEQDKKRTESPPPFLPEEELETWKPRRIDTSQKHSERLKNMQLRYGSTTVWKDGEKFFGWGDMEHCPVKDIMHNLYRLRNMIKNNPTWVYCGKSYQSDLYDKTKYSKKEKINEVRECIDLYKEPLFQVEDDDKITRILGDDLIALGYISKASVEWES